MVLVIREQNFLNLVFLASEVTTTFSIAFHLVWTLNLILPISQVFDASFLQFRNVFWQAPKTLFSVSPLILQIIILATVRFFSAQSSQPFDSEGLSFSGCSIFRYPFLHNFFRNSIRLSCCLVFFLDFLQQFYSLVFFFNSFLISSHNLHLFFFHIDLLLSVGLEKTHKQPKSKPNISVTHNFWFPCATTPEACYTFFSWTNIYLF